MFLLLPNSKGGLEDLLNSVSVTSLKRELLAMDQLQVAIAIPKFKFRFQSRMTQVLKEVPTIYSIKISGIYLFVLQMGLREIFQNTASFPGIATKPTKRLVVSDIIQKSGVEVDEEGSLAYALTGMDNKLVVNLLRICAKYGELYEFMSISFQRS